MPSRKISAEGSGSSLNATTSRQTRSGGASISTAVTTSRMPVDRVALSISANSGNNATAVRLRAGSRTANVRPTAAPKKARSKASGAAMAMQASPSMP